MRRCFVLWQLALWITSTVAFYPYFPPYRCGEGEPCHGIERWNTGNNGRLDAKKVKPEQRVAFNSPRQETFTESFTSRIEKIAHGLSRKYGSTAPAQTTRDAPELSVRANEYPVVTAMPPTKSNAAGVAQDGTDFSYFIPARLGSDSKDLYMLLDTGASTTWVMGSGCTSTACTMHDAFGPGDSDTLEDTGKTFSVEYGSGSVSGSVVSDGVAIAGMEVNMPFGLANVTSSDFTQFPFDGILGLSMSSSGSQNYLQALQDADLVDSKVFGVSLNRNSDGSNDGEVSFGAPNEDKYTGDISYTPIAGSARSSWAIPLDDVTFDGKSAGIEGRTAYIDTGTTYAFGPSADVADLFKLIPDSSSSDGGVTYTIPCDTDQRVAFSFSGKSHDVSSKDLMSEADDDGKCSCNIFGMEVVSGAWLLGDMFLKNVYTVFDMDETRIGFAAKAAVSDQAVSSQSTTTARPTAATSTGTFKSQSTTFSSVPASGSSTSTSPAIGLSGHETPSGTAATAPEETAASGTSTNEPSSFGSKAQLGSQYIFVLCVSFVMAVVA